MNLLQAIEHTSWQILSTFAEFGFSPARVLSEFEQNEAYHLYRTRRNKPSFMLDGLHLPTRLERPAKDPKKRSDNREFPFDVAFLTAEETTDMVRMSMLLQTARDKRGIPLNPRERIFLWNNERRDACLGLDIVARRCSMDDYLWAVYRHCRRRGMTLGVDASRHIHQTKRLIAPLFSKDVLGSRTGGGLPCYLSAPDAPDAPDDGRLENPPYTSAPDAPDETGEDGDRGRRIFDAVFEKLRERIELGSGNILGSGRGAN